MSLAVTLGMSYINCRHASKRITKLINPLNQIQTQVLLSSYKAALGSRLAKNISYSWHKNFFK